VSRRRRKMYCGRPGLCVCQSVCLSAAACLDYCTDPDVTWWSGRGCPSCALLAGFAIGARVALLWQHYGNAWQSPSVIRQAHRTLHALRYACGVWQRLPSPAIKSTRLLRAPFHFVHTAGVLYRERKILGSTCLYSLYA